MENFEEVVSRIPEQWRRFTPAFGDTFCSQEKLKELQQLFERNGHLTPGYQRKLAQTSEQVQLCIALRGRGEALFQTLSAQ
jgi:alanyl aminopeptidase